MPDWIDPEYAALGERLRARGLISLSPVNAPLDQCRAMFDRIAAFATEGSVPLARERELALPGPHGQIPCKLYLPDEGARVPLLVYAHGGSFALGTLPAWDGMLRDLVRQSGVGALSVDYRLAPEHRYPVAADEMLAVIRYAARNAESLGVDSARIAAGGDSAGANLALGAALRLRDDGDSPLKFLLLIYGVYSSDSASESWRRYGTGSFGLSSAQMAWIYENYLTDPKQADDFRVAPLVAGMGHLPPVHLVVGTLDPLQGDNEELAHRLGEAGVPHRLAVYDGLPHGFIRYGAFVSKVRAAVADCAAALGAALS